MAKKYGASLNAPINQPYSNFATQPGGKRISRATGNHVSGGGAQTATDAQATKAPGPREYQGTKPIRRSEV